MLPFEERMPVRRFAVEDIDLGDVLIRKGDAILLAFGAAGRDPSVHGDTACEFDVTRESSDHLAFGHGVHFFLGRRWAGWRPASRCARCSTPSRTSPSPSR
ncbi:cytochrome P450 [Streptomyces sp. NPDC050392]|uniref:cytochrome P450 n=1 Tax=Streptomyces sp. NPDC050392 TaxID=3155782 RepID=UPI00341A585C